MMHPRPSSVYVWARSHHLLNPYSPCFCRRPYLLRLLLLLLAAVAVATAVPTLLLLSLRMPAQYVRATVVT